MKIGTFPGKSVSYGVILLSHGVVLRTNAGKLLNNGLNLSKEERNSGNGTRKLATPGPILVNKGKNKLNEAEIMQQLLENSLTIPQLLKTKGYCWLYMSRNGHRQA